MTGLRAAVFGTAFVFACAAASAEAPQDAPLAPIPIAGGKIAGTTRGGIDRYFGIPFAAPPVGDLRWRAPQPVVPWTGVKDAAAFGPVCRQTVDWIKNPQSEDCLTLNVWAPAVKSDKPLPVMVWIHGGGFFGGTGVQMGPDAGNSLVGHGVILVTINYRLGVLGFFSHPELSAEGTAGNQAILDQIAALKWVKENIASFGGDPGNVTIFGESAGGGSVALLTMSPAAKGLFHRAIAESGTADALPPKADAETKGQAFAAALKAPHLKDLRKLPAETLLKPAWHPTVINDGGALPGNMADSYAKGWNNSVPIMTGWNADEGVDLAPETLGSKDITQARYTAAVKMVFGPNADAILQMYPAANDAEAKASATRLVTDMMGFSAYRWGAQQAGAKTAPAFVYYFVHSPAEPPKENPCGYGCKAGHGAEIRFAFDHLFLEKRDWTEGDRMMADRMIRYWTNFAKTGDPNGDGLPKWTAFDGNPPTVAVLGTDEEIKARGTFPDFRPWLSKVP